MEQELFSTAQIADELEHKSKNPRRDVLNIAKRLGFTPALEQTRSHNGKTAGGRPEKLWSREQRDAILADNHNRHKEPAQIDSPDETPQAVDDTQEPITDAKPVADPPVEPAPVVEVVTLADRANRIRKLQADVQRGIIEIGNELIAAKKQVGHGNWSAWIDKEFSWSDRTARRFMAVAERFGKMDNVVRFQPSVLQAMLALPEGDEQEFIDAQAAAGTPVEKQSAREVQKNVKQFKQRQAAKKDSDNTEPVDELQPVRTDVDAEEIEAREVVAEPMPAAVSLPAQMNEPDEDTNVVTTPAQVAAIIRKLIDETDDDQQLNSLKIALTDAMILIDAKRAVIAQKKLSRHRSDDVQRINFSN